MIRTLPLAVLSLILLASSLPGQRGRGRGRNLNPPTLQHLEFKVETFDSEALGREVSYGVFLPRDYEAEENQDRDYPLVIWLHGMFEDHQRFFYRGGGKMLDQLTGTGEVPQMIFVCANGDRSSFYINRKEPGTAYEDLISRDLIEHLQHTYRISDRRSLRAITGVSMGGYGAMKIAFKDPEAFGVVATHSAAVLPRTIEDLERDFPWVNGRGRQLLTSVFGDPIDLELWRRENLLLLVDSLDQERLAGLHIRIGCSDQDRYGFDRSNAELHELLAEKGIRHSWTLTKGGGHSWGSGYMDMALPDTLRYLASCFALPVTAQEPAKGPRK